MTTEIGTHMLDIKIAIQIAKILAAAPNERIPMILDVFSKAEVDINGLDELAEWQALTKQTALIDTEEFIAGIIKDRTAVDGEYRIKAEDFNNYCREFGVSARCARKHLYTHGRIRTGMDKGKINYTVPIWDEEKKRNDRCVCIKAKTE